MSSETDSREVRLTIPARAEYVGLLRLALSAVSRLTALSGDEVSDLKLAVDEAARRWVPAAPAADGHAFDLTEEPLVASSSERLAVRYGLRPTRLELDLRCPGPEVMPLSERRLSLAILGATADECHAEPGRIRLVKHLEPAAPT